MLKNIKAVSTKCTQHCKCCKIYCFVIQGSNPYVVPHTDWQYGDQAMNQQSKAVFMEIKFIYEMYLGFHPRKFPETAH